MFINPQTSQITSKIHKENKHINITYIQLSNKKTTNFLAAGFFFLYLLFNFFFLWRYEDGDIIIWNLNNNFEIMASLDGHKNAITCIRFNNDDTKLFTSGNDKSIIIWDLITETSLFK